MQFQVPQFIETEDKLIGPLNLKQFLALGGVAFVIFMLFLFLDFTLCLPVAFTLGIIGTASVLFKVNGRPMTVFLFSLFNYYWNPQLYLWKPSQPPADALKLYQLPKIPSSTSRGPLTGNIKALWNMLLTTKETITRRESPLQSHPSPIRQPCARTEFQGAYRAALQQRAARHVDYRKA